MGVSAEEGTEHGSEYMTNLIIANVETLSHDDSHSYSFSSDGHQFGGAWPLAPVWIRHCTEHAQSIHRPITKELVASASAIVGTISLVAWKTGALAECNNNYNRSINLL